MIRSSTLLLTSVDQPRAPGSRGCFTLSLLTTWVWVSMIMRVAPLRTDGIEWPWESTTRPQTTKPRDTTRVGRATEALHARHQAHDGPGLRSDDPVIPPGTGGCRAVHQYVDTTRSDTPRAPCGSPRVPPPYRS